MTQNTGGVAIDEVYLNDGGAFTAMMVWVSCNSNPQHFAASPAGLAEEIIFVVYRMRRARHAHWTPRGIAARSAMPFMEETVRLSIHSEKHTMRRLRSIAPLGALALTLSANSAFAQSSVTLYGLVDTSVRYLTNANSKNDSQVAMGPGVETPSRWGLKGSEDLGGGTSAVFKLENQFQLWSGKLDNSNNTLFQRNAYVGLSNDKYGTLTFGRQQTPFFDVMGNIYDPMTVGDYWQDSWIYNPVGPFLFTNNSVKYQNQFGGLHLEGMYGFGGVAGSTGENAMFGFTASYALGPLQADVGFQQNDVQGKKFNVVNVSAVYAFTPGLKGLVGWVHSQDNTGLADQDMQQAGAPTLPRFSPNRIDDSFYVGSTWQVLPPLALTFAGYYDHARNAARLDGSLGVGTNYSATILAEYSLSRRTEIYGTVDFTRGNGAFLADYPGRNNQTGVAIGMRNIF